MVRKMPTCHQKRICGSFPVQSKKNSTTYWQGYGRSRSSRRLAEGEVGSAAYLARVGGRLGALDDLLVSSLYSCF